MSLFILLLFSLLSLYRSLILGKTLVQKYLCIFSDIWPGVAAVQAGGRRSRARPHGPVRQRHFLSRRCVPAASPLGGHRLLDQEHRSWKCEYARASRRHTRQTRSGWSTARRVRYATTQSSRDQDGKVMCAAGVRAAATAAHACARASARACALHQVPSLAARLHVTAHAARLRPGQPR